jgi:predicted outer membrane repeat protein
MCFFKKATYLPLRDTTQVSTSAWSARSVFAADVDGDGDLDVLSASQYDHKIALYLNDGAPPSASVSAIHGDDSACTRNTPMVPCATLNQALRTCFPPAPFPSYPGVVPAPLPQTTCSITMAAHAHVLHQPIAISVQHRAVRIVGQQQHPSSHLVCAESVADWCIKVVNPVRPAGVYLAGITVSAPSPTTRGCLALGPDSAVSLDAVRFLNCTNAGGDQDNDPGGGGGGGAIRVGPGARLRILSDVSFNRCSAPAGSGGAINLGDEATLTCAVLSIMPHLAGLSAHIPHPTTSSFLSASRLSCIVATNCSAARDGGALYSASRLPLTLRQSSFKDNRAAGRGGALFLDTASTTGGGVALQDVFFKGNSADFAGGAVYALCAFPGFDSQKFCSLTLASGTTFQENDALAAGGALYLNKVKLTFHNAAVTTTATAAASFTSNTAAQSGGAIFWTGDLTLRPDFSSAPSSSALEQALLQTARDEPHLHGVNNGIASSPFNLTLARNYSAPPGSLEPDGRPIDPPFRLELVDAYGQRVNVGPHQTTTPAAAAGFLWSRCHSPRLRGNRPVDCGPHRAHRENHARRRVDLPLGRGTRPGRVAQPGRHRAV